MHRFFATIRSRPFGLYLLGLLVIFAGAWSMGASGSMVPMALASSAGLMLGAPLVRRLLARTLRTAPGRR